MTPESTPAKKFVLDAQTVEVLFKLGELAIGAIARFRERHAKKEIEIIDGQTGEVLDAAAVAARFDALEAKLDVAGAHAGERIDARHKDDESDSA